MLCKFCRKSIAACRIFPVAKLLLVRLYGFPMDVGIDSGIVDFV